MSRKKTAKNKNMKQQAINWWNKQDEYTQSLLVYLILKRIPDYSVTERQIDKIYRSYFKL